jgi:pyruvate dehydrogenase E1 component alpha subunit/2-oxoisovalerate dehydrogenase E1 component
VTEPAVKRSDIGGEHGRELYEQMLLIRRFEEKAAELYQLGKIRGFLHLYIGEEAVGVGAMGALGPDDSIVTTYRDHGHALARGISPRLLMAEMFGKSTGCSRGRGGSMHFFDAEHRFYGGYAIVGGGLPIAAGIALADKMMGRAGRITGCFFGDGAVAEGEFHETMNLASLWKLPVLFLCENNYYAMGTPLKTTLAETDITEKAKGYRIPAESVDGMDVVAVEQASRRAADLVRAGEGPRLLELRTYRFRGHSMADPELYREKAEVEEWKQRDPLTTFPDLLLDLELASAEDLERVERGVVAKIDDAVQFADESPWEPVEDLEKDVSGDQA